MGGGDRQGRSRSLLLELKHVKEEAGMNRALKEGADQIIRKKYASRLIYEGYSTRLQYSMAFWEKRAIIAKR